TRKKLARASSCIVEYVGRVAYFSGNKSERVRAREYLQWLLMQRVGESVHVIHKGRDDVTLIMVPSTCIGFITGHKGSSLRAIEEETSTFCFIEGAVDDGEDQKPLLIFGCCEDRCLAETLVWEKLTQKIDELGPGGEYGQSGRKGKGKGKNDKGGKSKSGQQAVAPQVTKSWAPREPKEGESVETLQITDDDAAFLMGPGGKTKRKVAAVSGADLELKVHRLDIIGMPEQRARAKKYVQLVMAQRVGPVRIEDPDKHDDLSIMEVPAEAVSFVTGKQGSFLRLVEEEFGTLLFFMDFSKNHRRDAPLERLAIFGPLRERRGAELKVMAAIEMKLPGYFTRTESKLPQQDPLDGFATDTLAIEEDDYSYALGKGGATRKKIARASNCIIEYIGRLAYLSGLKKERGCAREYLAWLFRQRVGPVEVNYSNREDVTVLQVPKDCVGFVTGHKGTSLRSVEEATGTFCFIEGGRDDPQRDPKPLLIFGSCDARRQAEELLRKRIDLKLVEGWVHEDGYGGGSYGGGYGGGYGRSYADKYEGYDGKSGGKSGYKGRKGAGKSGPGQDERGGSGDAATAAANGSLASPTEEAVEGTAASRGQAGNLSDGEDGAWGNWGGGSSDEEGAVSSSMGPSQGPAAGGGKAPVTPADTRANMHLLNASGRWSAQSASYSGTMAANMASPQRGAGSGSAGAGYSPARGAEEFDLPPHLMQEEAWPEIGQMGGGGAGALKKKKPPAKTNKIG
ncbi:unnamed protein product, partial [Polarella glacialis]